MRINVSVWDCTMRHEDSMVVWGHGLVCLTCLKHFIAGSRSAAAALHSTSTSGCCSRKTRRSRISCTAPRTLSHVSHAQYSRVLNSAVSASPLLTSLWRCCTALPSLRNGTLLPLPPVRAAPVASRRRQSFRHASRSVHHPPYIGQIALQRRLSGASKPHAGSSALVITS